MDLQLFKALFEAILAHCFSACLAVFLILIFVKRDEILALFKGWLADKNAALDKRSEELNKLNERYFGLYEKSSQALEKIGSAIADFKEGLLGVESRINSKIDTEMDLIRTEIRDNKIDQLTLIIQERQKSSPGFNS